MALGAVGDIADTCCARIRMMARGGVMGWRVSLRRL